MTLYMMPKYPRARPLEWIPMVVAALGFLCFLGLSAYVGYVEEGTQMQWSKNDPREHTTKGRIIVVTHNGMVMWGEVETKHGYCVFLYPQDKDFRRLVAEDESWPGWFWINAPHR